MSTDLLVSIVIPSLNKGDFIEETIASINDQNYRNIEIIVIDGGSNDKTIQILRRYRKAFAHCISEPDNGQSEAINKGVALAKGDIVGWLNADDLLYPDGIESIVKGFKNHQSAGLVYGGGSKIDIDGKIVKDIPYRAVDRRLLKQLYYMLQPSMYFKRKTFLDVGGVAVNYHLAMDWDLVLKVSKVADLVAVPQKIAKLRMYDGTKTSAGGLKTYQEIADIGRRHNGITDVNYISYHARKFLYKVDLPVLKPLLRKSVDLCCSIMARGELYMTCKWPEDL